jgi:hypothetical protein
LVPGQTSGTPDLIGLTRSRGASFASAADRIEWLSCTQGKLLSDDSFSNRASESGSPSIFRCLNCSHGYPDAHIADLKHRHCNSYRAGLRNTTAPVPANAPDGFGLSRCDRHGYPQGHANVIDEARPIECSLL